MVKAIALLVSMFSMPAYLRYFSSKTVLGLWFTILSVLSWILTFDLGIGNGLRNYLVPLLVQRDEKGIRQHVSSAYVVVSFFAIILMLATLYTTERIDWNIFFNIDPYTVPHKDLVLVVNVVLIGLWLQLLLKLITSILYAMQKSALPALLVLLSNCITLIFIIFDTRGSLLVRLHRIAIVNSIAVNLPLLITSFIVFNGELKNCRPVFWQFSLGCARKIIAFGGLFFGVQVGYMVITVTNEYFISRYSGPENVVEYQIYNRLFALAGSLIILAITPVWSAITKAIAEKKIHWIEILYKKLLVFSLLAVFLQFGMIPFLRTGIAIWLGKNALKINYVYALLFALNGSLFVFSGVLSSIANGFGELRIQLVSFTVGAILKIIFSVTLMRLFDSWIGVIVANIFSFGIYCILQPFWISKYLRKVSSFALHKT